MEVAAISAGSFISSSWYRVQHLQPRLAEHVRIHRHRYRGQLWYVIDDRATGRVHRFSEAAYVVMRFMNGEKTVEQIWRESIAVLGEQSPGQDAVIQLLGQLYANDLLKCQVAADGAELFERFSRQNKSLWWQNLRNPLSIRLPLWNPSAFLEATLPLAKPVFSVMGLILWLAIVGTGLLVAFSHWNELSENVADRVLATQSVVAIGLLFPAIKFFHEMGHAYATRVQGGEVHEMGIMLLALMVVPYVDAGSAAGFSDKWRRALVGAAGMMVELMIASVAVVAWTLLEPGLARALLFDTIFVAGVSTIVFNANPLLRYDGYYILSDLIEIPNLAPRAQKFWAYLLEYRLFRIARKRDDESTGGERRWFLFYAPASYSYRFLVMMGIAIFLANQFYVVGVVLALWGGFSMLVLPVLKGGHYLLFSAKLHGKRRRALIVSGVALAMIASALFVIRLPIRTQAEGVLWLPEQAELRAGTGGFVKRILVPEGSHVEAGQALVECEDPVLDAEIRVYRARIEELEAQYRDEWVNNKVKTQLTREELQNEQARLRRAQEREAQLLIRAKVGGRLQIGNPQDLPGRFLRQGELVGLVVNGATDLARVVVLQDNIDLVRRRTEKIEVRFADFPSEIYPASLVREVPGAQAELPSAALGTAGGGERTLDPRDEHGTKSLDRVFQFDLNIANPAHGEEILAPYGSRLYVRFHHSPEPLATQWGRRIRQLFLSRLSI